MVAIIYIYVEFGVVVIKLRSTRGRNCSSRAELARLESCNYCLKGGSVIPAAVKMLDDKFARIIKAERNMPAVKTLDKNFAQILYDDIISYFGTSEDIWCRFVMVFFKCQR